MGMTGEEKMQHDRGVVRQIQKTVAQTTAKLQAKEKLAEIRLLFRLTKATAKAYEVTNQIEALKAETQKRAGELDQQYAEAITEVTLLRQQLNKLQGNTRPMAIVTDYLESSGSASLKQICEATGLKRVAVSKFLRKHEQRGNVARQLTAGQKRGAVYRLVHRAKDSVTLAR